MKVDLDEMARLARAATPGNWTAITPPADQQGWSLGHVVAAVAPGQRIYTDHRGGIAVEANRQHIAANGPLVTIALVARIRELEAGYGDLLGEVEERSDNPGWYVEHAELLAKGAVLP